MVAAGVAERGPAMTDTELLESLRDLDRDEDYGTTTWEANFLESVLTQTYPLTPRQRETAEAMIKRWENGA